MEIKDLEKRKIVIYGTGVYARSRVPYLLNYSDLEIVGFTNSHTTGADGNFPGTDLPIYTIQAWKEKFPQAAVLVATSFNHYAEILGICKKAEFQDVALMDRDFLGDCLEKYFMGYFRKNGISFQGEYFHLGNLNLLTLPSCKGTAKYSYYVELSDFIMPHYDTHWVTGWEGPYDRAEGELSFGATVLDCGANTGLFSAHAASKGCICYAFEPTPELQPLIQRHSELNQDRIIPVQAALSDNVGIATFCLTEFATSNYLSKVEKRLEFVKEIQVPQTTIDHFVEEQGLTRVDFIKADIEGAERLMLAGAQKTLAEFAPRLAICTYHLPDDKEVLTGLILKANPNYQIEYQWEKLYAHVPG